MGFFLPAFAQTISITILLASISLTIFFIFRTHLQSHQQAECTREKMICNILIDLLGLGLVIGAAIYIGRLAGAYFGLQSGLWIGLLSGFLGGFITAWLIKALWGKFVRTASGG